MIGAIHTRPESRPHAKETASGERNAISPQNDVEKPSQALGGRRGRLQKGPSYEKKRGQRAGLTKRKQLSE